jgi:hypothetical protein
MGKNYKIAKSRDPESATPTTCLHLHSLAPTHLLTRGQAGRATACCFKRNSLQTAISGLRAAVAVGGGCAAVVV